MGITGNGDGSYDYRLTGLRKYTHYSVVVKAFNNKGDGPGSIPSLCRHSKTVSECYKGNMSSFLLHEIFLYLQFLIPAATFRAEKWEAFQILQDELKVLVK